MKLVLAHSRMMTLELARFPSFIVPTLLFPALFFLFFAVPGAERENADLMLSAYVGFAFLGVAFFQFGVGIASERAAPWELFLRTLPVLVWQRLAARVVSALAFATASGFVVVVVALTATPASLTGRQWLALAAALLVGSIPFALLGISIGYLASPKGALPLANLLYLTLAYLGEIWTGPQSLPHGLSALSQSLPTRQWMEILWAAARDDAPHPVPSLALAGWGIGFALLAVWAYRRDEGQRFR